MSHLWFYSTKVTCHTIAKKWAQKQDLYNFASNLSVVNRKLFLGPNQAFHWSGLDLKAILAVRQTQKKKISGNFPKINESLLHLDLVVDAVHRRD